MLIWKLTRERSGVPIRAETFAEHLSEQDIRKIRGGSPAVSSHSGLVCVLLLSGLVHMR